MFSYAIGLDIGIASVGWAALSLDEKENPCGIINMGSRIFDAAEQPKTGESLAAPRREARSSRRRLRRHRHRGERIRQLLICEAVVSQKELDALFDGQLEDIYELRARALDDPVTTKEFARILIHLAQRRGFRSNRKTASDKEEGQVLEAVSENCQRILSGGYRTAGEMFCKDPLYADHKRNKGGKYISTITREMAEDEARKIFSAQRSFGAAYASEAVENKYVEILLSQRSFDDGPGGDSPYGGNQIERMVGSCVFLPAEQRAAKATYSFEYFNLLQHINHIRICENGKSAALTADQRSALIELAHKTANLDFSKIRTALHLSDGQTFNTVRYENGKSKEECEKKEKFCWLKAYHQMRTALDKVAKGRIACLSKQQRNDAATALTLYKTSAKIRESLEAAGLENPDIDALETIGGFSKFGHLSVKACDEIIPYLEQGMNYNDACAAAGHDFKAHKSGKADKFLHPKEDDFSDITSPVVRRAVSQTIKVVNAIIREQGNSPVYLNIELAREMSKDFSERKQIEKEMKENQAKNDRMMERIRSEYGHIGATGLDLVKLKLFEEQAGVCAYSLKQMSLERLFEPNYAEVDHIVPYSLSFDDRYCNKVLVLTEENRNKAARLPMQYLTGKRKDDFVVWVNSSVRDRRKKQLLLKEGLTDEDASGFKERNLQDTKYMSRFLFNYINDNLEFAPSACGRKKKVTAVNGAVTSYIRKRWGINKIREDGDLHHAVDAVVIACITDGMIQQISRFAQLRECSYVQGDGHSMAIDEATGEVLRKFPYPWRDFRRELDARTANDPARVLRDSKLHAYLDDDRLDSVKLLFVSRMPQRKVTGAAHKDTIKSARLLDEGYTVVRRPLSALKLDSSGEIENYYSPESDTLLYDALKKRLAEYGGKGERAFQEPFYKPKRDGTPGPHVDKVKLCEKTTLNVEVHNGEAVAAHESMVRVDVFYVKDEGYYLVPIYVADTLKPELPSKACIAHRPYSQWKDMADEDFLFSLYPNDLIRVTHKTKLSMAKVSEKSTLPDVCEVKSELVYYKGMNISTGAITCINHDNTYKIDGFGAKTLVNFEKYTVDVLGNYYKVGKEKRQPFNIKRS